MTAASGKLIKGASGDWEVVIGMEVHAQVTSKSKLFSGASTAFGGEPRSHVVCRKRLPERDVQPADDVARGSGRHLQVISAFYDENTRTGLRKAIGKRTPAGACSNDDRVIVARKLSPIGRHFRMHRQARTMHRRPNGRAIRRISAGQSDDERAPRTFREC